MSGAYAPFIFCGIILFLNKIYIILLLQTKSTTMALDIKRNDSGKYRIISTVTDECLHGEDWIDAHKAKTLLMQRELQRFMENMMGIAADFPVTYCVNGKYVPGAKTLNKWMLDKIDEGQDAFDKAMTDRFVGVIKEYGFMEYFSVLVNGEDVHAD